ncbi:TetR/AcrR family transcriptional regulator [Desulfovibrio inopinatus]|uniref:TetR/AcrR family transcriptional regulator n=1 Tax=Desulfovibrio inopinatus TaxID=102109 RepID=UPI0006863530|nr:TetR/AcrR family transcriptional regulator [Desulfovibrio inopinatus]
MTSFRLRERGARANGAEKKRIILDAAQELFGTYGYSGTTMKMVSEKAGVAFGLVSHYFGNKEELFMTAGFSMVDAVLLRVRVEMSRARSGIEAIEIFTETYLSYTTEHRRRFSILIRCSPFSDVEHNVDRGRIAEKFLEIIREIENCLKRGIADGSIRNVPIRETAFMIYGSIVGAVRTSILTPYELPHLYNTAQQFIVSSLIPKSTERD